MNDDFPHARKRGREPVPGADSAATERERIAQYARHLHPSVVQYVRNERIAAEYDEYFRDNQLFQFDCTVLERELPAGGKILDAGCGSGRHLVYLGQRGFQMYGLDLSEPFLAVARRKLQEHGLPVRLRRGDILRPPADLLPAGERFDGVILMFSVLGMVQGGENRVQALRGLREWLAPGGVLVAHVHNRLYGKSVILEKLARLRGWLPGGGQTEAGDHVIRNYRGILDLYLHSFSGDELCACARSAGWEVTRLLPLNACRDGVYEDDCDPAVANGYILVAKNPVL